MKARVQTMALVHSMLSQNRLSIDLRSMLQALMPSETPCQVDLAGPHVMIPSYQTMPMGMVIQELYTNSMKHGAMSASGGTLRIAWSLEANSGGPAVHLRVQWCESGGPTILARPAPASAPV